MTTQFHWRGIARASVTVCFIALATGFAQGQTAPITNLTLANASEPNSRVLVPRGDTVRITAQSEMSGASWYKDGVSIPNTGSRTLLLTNIDFGTSGTYSYKGGQPAVDLGNQIELTVTDVSRGHVANYSSRVTLNPGSSTQISGFVVVGTRTKSLLVRAVGESLKRFGINYPVKNPRIQLYKGEIPLGFTIPTVIEGPDYWARVFANAGAFPLDGNEQAWVAFGTGAFAPGSYTIHVSDDSKQGGEVLIEVYEITVATPRS